MQKKYIIPASLISVAVVGFLGTMQGPSETSTNVSEPSITDNTTLGYDYEYSFDVPRLTGEDVIVVRLPERANTDPVGLFTDDFGDRLTFDGTPRNEREFAFRELEPGSYHFVYTSFGSGDFLVDGDVFVEQ